MRALRTLLAGLMAFALLGGPALAEGEGDKAPPKDRATKDDYELDPTGTTGELKVGDQGTFSLIIRAKNGLKIHPQAPLEVKLKDAPGLKVEKQKLGRGDVANKGDAAPDLRTGLSAIAAGTHNVEADVSFFLCSDTWCHRMTDRLSVGIKVTE